MHNNYKSNAV